jgi:hypothetical protein
MTILIAYAIAGAGNAAIPTPPSDIEWRWEPYGAELSCAATAVVNF